MNLQKYYTEMCYFGQVFGRGISLGIFFLVIHVVRRVLAHLATGQFLAGLQAKGPLVVVVQSNVNSLQRQVFYFFRYIKGTVVRITLSFRYPPVWPPL